jgi:hypothetical protein
MKNKKLLLIPIFLMILPFVTFAQKKNNSKKEAKIHTFISLDGRKSFLSSVPKMFGFKVGAKIGCKFIFGFGFHKLTNSYETTINLENNTNLNPKPTNTPADIKLQMKNYTMFIAPIILKHKKLDFIVPIHLGISDIHAQYYGKGDYHDYFHKTPWLVDASGLFGFRIFSFLGVNVGAGYIYHMSSDKEVKKLNTATLVFSLKFGGGCKE